jgi:hypothetical protein
MNIDVVCNKETKAISDFIFIYGLYLFRGLTNDSHSKPIPAGGRNIRDVRRHMWQHELACNLFLREFDTF